MKIILLLIIILIFYLIYNKSNCNCDLEGFKTITDKKSFRKQLFKELYSLFNIKEYITDDKQKSKLLVEDDERKFLLLKKQYDQSISEENGQESINEGQKIFTKLLTDTLHTSQCEMKKEIEKVFGKVYSEVIDSYYDDKFKINSDLGILNNVLPVVKNIDEDGKIHITNLPKRTVPIRMNLLSNYNNIINSGEEIYQDILKPESNQTSIYNVTHNLMKVSWVKSSLQWVGNNIQLEIRFTYVNPNKGTRLHIVFPVVLVDTYVVMEKFTDTYYTPSETYIDPANFMNKKSLKKGIMFPVLEEKLNTFSENPMIIEFKKENKSLATQMKEGTMNIRCDSETFKENIILKKEKKYHSGSSVKNALKNFNINKINIKTIPKSVDLNNFVEKLNSINFNIVTKDINNVKYSYNDIDSLLNLNSLIVDTSLVPDYICCSSTIGNLINIDFNDIQKKILAQDYFYYTHGNDGSLYFITQPHPYEKKIGNVILENLSLN